MGKLWQTNKGDRFLVFNADGELIRGVVWADEDKHEYGKLYVHGINVDVKSRQRTKVSYKVVRESFTVVEDKKARWSRRDYLIKLIKDHEWTRGAEIGCAKGGTTFALLNQCPDLYLIAVDYWPEQYKRLGQKFKTRAREWKDSWRFRLIEKPSVEAAEDVEDGSLDFVFVDADHSEESCAADINAWFPKLNYDGIMLGHDWNWTPVQEAVVLNRPQGYKLNIWWPDNVWSYWPQAEAYKEREHMIYE